MHTLRDQGYLFLSSSYNKKVLLCDGVQSVCSVWLFGSNGIFHIFTCSTNEFITYESHVVPSDLKFWDVLIL